MDPLELMQKQVAELQSTVDTLNNTCEELKGQVNTLQKENAALAKVPESASKPAAPLTIPAKPFKATDGKKKYVFTSAKFILPARKGLRTNPISITAEDALADQSILDELIANNMGVIKELV